MTPLLLGLTLTLAAPAPKETPKTPPSTKLDGEWVVESMEGPKEMPKGGVVFQFVDGKVFIKEAMRPKPEEAAYTTDATKKPAQIDIRPGKGGKEIVVPGIYEIRGDTLKIAFGRDGTERPTEFKGDAAKRIMAITLKRQVPPK